MNEKEFSVSGMVSADRGWRAIFLSSDVRTGVVEAVYLKTIVGWVWGTKDNFHREIFPVIFDYGSPRVLLDDNDFFGCLAPGQSWEWAMLEQEGVNGVFEWIDRPGFEASDAPMPADPRVHDDGDAGAAG